MKKIAFLPGLFMIVSSLFFPEAEACEQRSVDAVLIAKAMAADYRADEPVEPDLTKRMLKNLKSNDPFKRADAVQVLGEIRDERSFEALINALGDNNVFVRGYAAEALGKFKDARAVEPLISLLRGQEPFVQAYAIEALGELKTDKAVDAIVEVLNSGDPAVRAHAAWALGNIKDVKTITHLIKALHYEECCNEAAEALRKITNHDFGINYQNWIEWWEHQGRLQYY
jgi:HEAT repeat protein